MLTDRWVAVDKPPGILVHRTKLYKSAPREKYLTDYVSHLAHQETGIDQKILPVQRLDRPTSGVIVFALGCASNASELQAALQSQDCVKQYWALAFGAHMPKKWVNDHPLKDIDGKERKQRNARTEFEVIEAFDTADVVAVSACLSTGRRHQVRRHLSNSRHPILGDTSYCKGKLNRMVRDIYGVKRCCLHSQTLSFKDPSTTERVIIHAPLPSDLHTVLNHVSNLKANPI
ncbi:RNA pseudouridylate synthase [Gracilaria domingensis]|nr:RNA pseudouridylate synthase [Gracilaria domingensis]